MRLPSALMLAAAGLSATSLHAQGVALGDPIPGFALTDTATGQPVESSSLKPPVLVLFIATQCPVSNAYNERMATIGREYGKKGVTVVGVNSNRQESADEVAQHARTHGFSFPVLKDPKNVQADVFAAKVTPEAFLFDAKGKLAYHGRIDDNREGNAIKSPDLTQALDAVLSGKPAPTPETKAFGCTIKRVQ